ncbi:MAG: hypothetical protein JST86_16935 [Bacteroidetes bacterium]|nr:hypothetical protein [Bacteroidota bacterium]
MNIWWYFVITLAIELPVIAVLFRKQLKNAMAAGFLLNLFTWPLLNILLYYTSANVNIMELGVAVTESIGYYVLLQCSFRKALLAGFLANLLSYGAGLIINHYL